MTNENKKSIIEEAVSDLKRIREAADKNAMEKLVKAFPKKFELLLKEELEKVSNKESGRKEPVNGKNKESIKDKKTDKINESIMDIREMSLGEIEGEYDGAPEDAEFQVEPDNSSEVGIELTMNDIEEELAKMEGLANNMEMNNPKMGGQEMGEANNNAENDGDPFSKIKNIFNQLGEMVKEMEDQKMHEQYNSMFEEQMKGMWGESFRESLGDEKCDDLYETFIAHKKGEPFGDNSHKSPNVNESDNQPYDDKSKPSEKQGKSIDEEKEVDIDEMHNKVPHGATAPAKTGHNTNPAGITEWNFDKKENKEKDEVEIEVGDKKIEIEDKEEEEKEDDVDEAMGISISAGTTTPGKLGDHEGTHGRFRQQNESFKKKMNGLIGENKRITKELNENKKSIINATKLVESYRSALEKYRNQLSEMAVFNTNLANVNNLLVNEQLALTTEDKVKIINKFKSINSITESEKGYKEILSEMKSAKKTMTENVEEKMSNSLGESASKKLDEAIERTAYSTNEQVQKIKRVMDYVEKGKRI